MLDSLRDQGLHPAELVARLRLGPSQTVADIGAGPGYFTLPLARAVPTGKVLALDVNASYLANAERRARDAGLGNVEVRQVGPTSCELAPSTIDLAFLAQVDQALPDPARYLDEVRRALRPGGRVVVVNYARRRAPLEAAARAAGLRPVEEWSPTPPFYMLVLRTGGSDAP